MYSCVALINKWQEIYISWYKDYMIIYHNKYIYVLIILLINYDIHKNVQASDVLHMTRRARPLVGCGCDMSFQLWYVWTSPHWRCPPASHTNRTFQWLSCNGNYTDELKKFTDRRPPSVFCPISWGWVTWSFVERDRMSRTDSEEYNEYKGRSTGQYTCTCDPTKTTPTIKLK